MGTGVITTASIKLRNIYLGREQTEELGLRVGEKYSILIDGDEQDDSMRGTLTASYLLGGLSRLYKRYELTERNKIEIRFDDGTVLICPEADKRGQESIDVLICWEDDCKERERLPSNIVVLKSILQTAVESNEIEL